MKIGIAGLGIVGGALADWLTTFTPNQVAKYDPAKGLDDDFGEVDAVFICVPAATCGDRTQDLEAIRATIRRYGSLGVPFLVRTTVLPGTTDRLADDYQVRVLACPEFLTERRAREDMKNLPVVCGLSKSGLAQVEVDLYKRVFPGKRRIFVSNAEAELSKYVHNAYAAVKVNFFNTVYRAATALGADYGDVVEAARVTGFIEPEHTLVPGPDGRRGYGGKCLPKDLSAFIGLLEEMREPTTSLRACEADNDIFRGRDAE